MRKEVLFCDGHQCGKQDNNCETIRFIVGKTLDPAGGRAENDVEELDLCPKCCGKALRNIVRSLSHKDAEEWYSKIKTGRGNTSFI